MLSKTDFKLPPRPETIIKMYIESVLEGTL